MKNFFIISMLLFVGCNMPQKIEVEATVISHNISSSVGGKNSYHTIVITQDSCVFELDELKYYIMPVGSTTKVKVWKVCKK